MLLRILEINPIVKLTLYIGVGTGGGGGGGGGAPGAHAPQPAGKGGRAPRAMPIHAVLCLSPCPGSQGGGKREPGTYCLRMRLIYRHSGNSVIL